MKKSKRHRMAMAGAVLLLSGLLCVLAGVGLLVSKKEDMSVYPSVEAEVLSKGYHISMMRFLPYLKVRYTVEGREYISECGAMPEAGGPGTKVRVHYDPRQPQRLRPKVRTEYLLLVTAGTLCMIWGFGLLWIFFINHGQNRKDWL